jgi:catechol 2,3-dioxygenase-like lactoylglutathione lyase family enzyme
VTIDHVTLNVRDYDVSRRFYERALAPLGYRIVFEDDEWRGCGFGVGDKPYLILAERGPSAQGAHVAFHCDDRASVDAFHAAGVAAGGVDNGAPGLRGYHPNYYGAYVLDPDGTNVEAVCHEPTESS